MIEPQTSSPERIPRTYHVTCEDNPKIATTSLFYLSRLMPIIGNQIAEANRGVLTATLNAGTCPSCKQDVTKPHLLYIRTK